MLAPITPVPIQPMRVLPGVTAWIAIDKLLLKVVGAVRGPKDCRTSTLPAVFGALENLVEHDHLTEILRVGQQSRRASRDVADFSALLTGSVSVAGVTDWRSRVGERADLVAERLLQVLFHLLVGAHDVVGQVLGSFAEAAIAQVFFYRTCHVAEVAARDGLDVDRAARAAAWAAPSAAV